MGVEAPVTLILCSACSCILTLSVTHIFCSFMINSLINVSSKLLVLKVLLFLSRAVTCVCVCIYICISNFYDRLEVQIVQNIKIT